MESVSINMTAARHVDACDVTWLAHTHAPLGTLRKTRSLVEPRVGRGKAGHGRAGQAFALLESGVRDGATAKTLPRTAASHKQGDQAAKTKPPSRSCSRILDQSLGPTRARCSRNRLLELPSTMAGLARGWAGRSPPLTPSRLSSHRTSDPDLTYFTLVTRRSNRGLCLSCENCLLE